MATRRQLPPLQSATTPEVDLQASTPEATTPPPRSRRAASALTQPTNTLARQEPVKAQTPQQDASAESSSLLMDDADGMIADDLAAFQQSMLGDAQQGEAEDRPSRSLAIQSLRSGTQRRDATPSGRPRSQEAAPAIPTRETLAPQPRNLMATIEAEPAPVVMAPVVANLDAQQVDQLTTAVSTQVAQQIRSVETVLDGVNAQVTALPDTVQDLLQQVQDNTLAHLSNQNPQNAMAGVEEILTALQAQQASQIQQLQGTLKRQAMMIRLTCVAAIVAVVVGAMNLAHIQELPRQIQQVQGQQDDTNRRLDQLKQTTRFIESHVQALTTKVQRALVPLPPVVPGDGPATGAVSPTQ